MRYSYPRTLETFAEVVLSDAISTKGHSVQLTPDIISAIESVRTGVVDRAVVPIETSIDGGVANTLDALVAGSALIICGEQHVPMELTLARCPGARGNDIARVFAFPDAWIRTQTWISKRFPYATRVQLSSAASSDMVSKGTIEAYLRMVGQEGRENDGIVLPTSVATSQGLHLLAREIDGCTNPTSRFVSVSRPGRVAPRSGNDRTTFMAQPPGDGAGVLLMMLEQLATHGVSLSRIESRPAGRRLGKYVFHIDAEGHIDDENVSNALESLRRVCPTVIFLGSYPRDRGTNSPIGAGFADCDFKAARKWLLDIHFEDNSGADDDVMTVTSPPYC